MCMYRGRYVQVRGQLSGVCSLSFHHVGPRILSLGHHQTWWHLYLFRHLAAPQPPPPYCLSQWLGYFGENKVQEIAEATYLPDGKVKYRGVLRQPQSTGLVASRTWDEKEFTNSTHPFTLGLLLIQLQRWFFVCLVWFSETRFSI